MFKKILFSSALFILTFSVAFSQPITVSNISTSGHFSNAASPTGCGLGLPVVTATYLSGTGSTVSGGVITCTDQCGFTTVRISITNVRWTKNPQNNWFHGISFTPSNVTAVIPPGGLPAGWAAFPSSTGSCSSGITTGFGFYFDGSTGQSCCPGITANDGIPGNNYGDPVADCGFDYAFTFDLTFCNSSITNNPLLFQARGTSDYQTGCWTGVDPTGTSRIQFVLGSSACTSPIYSTAPSAAAPVKDCTGPTVNYTSTLTGGCGNGSNVTWWTASTGGTQIGSGSPFVYDPAGSVCPGGTTVYAACCPVGSTCATRVAVGIPNSCASTLTITNVATTNPTCSNPNGSIDGVTVTNATGTVTYTLTPGGASNTTGIFPNLTGTNYTLSAVDAAGCTATANVTFTPSGGSAPAAPVVTTPVTYCQNATAVPLTATGTNLMWYTVATGGTGSTTAPTPSTTTVGSTIYYVSQSNGCESPRAAITVTINAGPAAPVVTTPVTYCQNATATALTATGTNLLWYTAATGGTGSTTAPTPSTATIGSTTYYVSQTSGSCESPRAAITVTVNSAPAAPGVTTSVTYCQNATATPLTATGTNLLWYTAPTGGTGSATAPTPSTATIGSTTYYVSQTSGCESPRAAITVTINSAPAAPGVTTPVTYCQNATAVPLTATGTNLLWYTAATGGTGSTTAPTPSTATVGSTTYYVSQTTSGCESPRTSITVTINSAPAAPGVSSPVTYCQNATAAALTATGTNLLWYTAATGGTGSTTAPIPSTATIGNTIYYVSQTSGSCESPRAALTVTINALPAAPGVTTPVTYCQNATAVPLIATGTNVLWYTAPTGGTGSATAPTPSTATIGSTIYYVSQTTGTCQGARAAITVNVIAAPGAPTVTSPLLYCQGASVPALTATGTGLLWYTTPTGGTGSPSAPTPSTSTVGATNYYVSQSTGTCEGPRAMITVNITAALTANAGPSVTIQSGASTQLNGTGSAGANYLWTANGPLSLSNATILNPIANPAQTTIYTLTVSATSGLCPSASDSMIVTVETSCVNVRNAFSPNGDGINDTWLVYDQTFCLQPNSVRVNVFNRYGNTVFETKNYTNNWNGTYKGKPVPDGTYYGVVEFTLSNGNKRIVKTDLTLLR